MTKTQASRLCDDINRLNCGRLAEIEFVTNKYNLGYPCAVKITHKESGNEIGYAATADEGKYILAQLEPLRRTCEECYAFPCVCLPDDCNCDPA